MKKILRGQKCLKPSHLKVYKTKVNKDTQCQIRINKRRYIKMMEFDASRKVLCSNKREKHKDKNSQINTSKNILKNRCKNKITEKEVAKVIDKNNKKLRRVSRVKVSKKRVYSLHTFSSENNKAKNSVLSHNSINNLKVFLKGDNFKKVSKGLTCAIISLLSINAIDKINRKVFLNMDGQELTWSTSDNLDSSNYDYQLFRDKELLIHTKGYKFIESISLDKESPQKIDNVEIDKGETKVVLKWDAPVDIGTSYKYKVLAINRKSNKKYSSRKVKKDITSGISKYVLKINGVEYITITPRFEIDINSLKVGVNNIEIVAMDLAGNKSDTKNITFRVDNTKFYLNGSVLNTNNKEITDKTHNIYLVKEKNILKNNKTVVEKEKNPIKIGDSIIEFFMNSNKPSISNPRYIYENDLVNVVWEANSFEVNNTEFYIECYKKGGSKKYVSSKMKYDNGDFLPGYYYKVTTTPLYVVTQKDSYTMDSRVSLDTQYYNKDKIYYFHVASSDSYGNLSKTKTLELDFKNFTTTGEIKDVVRGFLYRNKGVSSDSYRKVTDDVYNAFTYKTIKKIKQEGLKISLVPTDIGDFISKNHTVKATNKNAQYIKEDSTIVYNVNSSVEYLIKEIVKVFDEYAKSPWSKNKDFLKVYNLEKKVLKNNNYTPQDYLAEIVWMYISGSEDLEYELPKSYEFVNRFYKSIMFA